MGKDDSLELDYPHEIQHSTNNTTNKLKALKSSWMSPDVAKREKFKPIKYESNIIENEATDIWMRFLAKPKLNILSEGELIKQRNIINFIDNKS